MNNIDITIKNLRKNNFQSEYFEKREDLLLYIRKLIASGSSVGFGGSITLKELNLQHELEYHGCNVFWHWHDNTDKDILEKALNADIYITSSNAITFDGKIINRDGVGNRVANMFYHHRNVFVICGINKIVETVDDAIDRIEKIAAPLNAKRLNMKTPCVTTGYCVDCSSMDRICNVTTIISKNTKSNIHVLILGEEIGY